MEQLVFATNNLHKLTEVRSMLEPAFKIISLADINCFDDIPETADTLDGNALLKANFVYSRFGLNCFADDTGLEIESLNGAPGVYSARYAGEDNNAQNNMNKVLSLLTGNNSRKASFRTVIALIQQNKISYFEGKIEGVISTEPQGVNGFGYDPIFIPNGYDVSFAELDAKEKNKISHRALAVEKLVNYLKSTVNDSLNYEFILL
jgi:XTP/dITP diphosphohydrolase